MVKKWPQQICKIAPADIWALDFEARDVKLIAMLIKSSIGITPTWD